MTEELEMTRHRAMRLAEDLSPVETRMLLRALLKELSAEDIVRCMREELGPMVRYQIVEHLKQQ